MQSTNRSGEGGRRACYVTSDLSYDQEREKKKGEDNKWDGERKNVRITAARALLAKTFAPNYLGVMSTRYVIPLLYSLYISGMFFCCPVEG